MKQIISKITSELKKNIDLEYKEGATKFFKEEVNVFGVRVPIVRKIGRKYFQSIKNWDKEKIFSLCEELLKKNYDVYRTIVFQWIYNLKKQYRKEDFKIFSSWLKKYVTNWAACDDFCTHAFGYLVTKYPEFLKQMNKFAMSKNMWERRAAAVILIHAVKRKKHLKKVFEIADVLMQDKEDLVQKGYGWMLKEASNLYPKQVFSYVMKHKTAMPRTALRYAIEKYPKEMRYKAMGKLI